MAMPGSRFRFGSQACALLLAGAVSPLARAQSEPVPPRIFALNGAVTLKRSGAAARIPATVGLTLSAGDQLATAGRASAEVQFDNRVFQLGANTGIRLAWAESGAYRVAIDQGTVTCQVVAAPAAALELATPSVRLKPEAAGVYRVAVTAAGESQITAQAGNVEVFAPAGSVWVLAGQKMLARGPADNPEFKIVSAVSKWRKFVTVTMVWLQVAGDASASFSGGGSGARPAPKAAAAHPAGSRPPSEKPPSAPRPSEPPRSPSAAPPASSGKGR
jgi:hypothetical protein